MIVQYLWLAFIVPIWAISISQTDHLSSSNSPALNFSTYAPLRVHCPSRDQWVREADGISDDEATWVSRRKLKVLQGLQGYLGNLCLEDFDHNEYIKALNEDHEKVPIIAYAISGGAWASALTGTAPLRAFDARYAPAVEQRTGGLLQSLTYTAGLSGGSWPIMSLATNNFPEIDDMIRSWRLDESPIDVNNNTRHRATPEKILKQVASKFNAGFNVSFADYLGRAVSYEFVAGPDGGIASLLSDVTTLSNFQDHEMPFPIWQGAQSTSNDVLEYGIREPFYNATFFEWSPFEFGAWDGPKGFFPIQYLGTKMKNGVPAGECVMGFDRVSFLLGAAANAFNYWLLGDLSNNTYGSFSKRSSSDPNNFPIATIELLKQIFQQIFSYDLSEDLYLSLPNPFATNQSINNNDDNPANLTILDSSEAGQGLPLWSLAQPARKMDFIITWDNTQDALPYAWENGTDMYDAYTYAARHNIPFPIVPPFETFLNRGLNTRPTFFGCDAHLTSTNDTRAPIVLYMANAPYSSYTNFSGFQESFAPEQMDAIMLNGFDYVTQGNGTLDAEWPECLACAAVDRSLARVGMQRTPQCQRCMIRYCWDGVEDNRTPDVVDLPLRLDPSLSFAEWNASAPYWPIES